MRLKSGSLWTAAILHASHNLYIQAIFTPLTRNTGKTAWFIDEFGAILPIVANHHIAVPETEQDSEHGLN
jgi:membrane protease YdiL (CAAX protease family)